MFNVVVLFVITQLAIRVEIAETFNITNFIKKYNYPVEVHNIETPDGYILELHRIPHGRLRTTPKEVVLLVHGLSGSAENFIVLGAPDALAFYLSDRRYDVWLFNARGNAHSRKHRSLNPDRDRKKFWDFSWHEIGIYDLPTTVMKTDKDNIFYVGHSQGGTSLLVMLSEVPEMNKKIKVAALLAAGVKLQYTPSAIITLLSRLTPLFQRLLAMFNWHEFIIPNSSMINRILVSLCKGKMMVNVCMDALYIVGGAPSGYIDKTFLLTILENAPSGSSVRQPFHYAQVLLTGQFKPYDFGRTKNLKIYNSTKPSLYNLSNANAPIGLFYADADHFSNKKMTEELAKELPNVVLKYEVEPKNFNHVDYILASNAREAVYDALYKLFEKYESNT